MPRRGSKNSSTKQVQTSPVPPAFKPKAKPRGRPMSRGEDPRRSKEAQWPKGVSGNPGGRPVKAMREIRAEHMPAVPTVISYLRAAALGIRPITGPQLGASREFLDRIVGKVPLPIVGGGEGEPPVAIDAPSMVDELRRIVGEPVKAAAAQVARAQAETDEQNSTGTG